MFCSRCGLKVEEGNQFCQNCGQAVGTAAASAAASTPTTPIAQPAVAAAPISGARPFAGFWLRFVAYLIDGLILAIPSWLILILAFSMFGGIALLTRMGRMNGTHDPAAVMALLVPMILGFVVAGLFVLLVQWLYFAGMESSERQGTFGKAAMSLRVTDLEGHRLSVGHATGRFFSKIITGLIPLGIGYIMAGFTAKKQALHDMIAGTIVLRQS